MRPRLILEIPAEVVEAARLPPDQVQIGFLRELALALYQRGILSSGMAQVLAQVTRWEFEDLLGERRVLRHYTQTDLEEDIQYAQRDQ